MFLNEHMLLAKIFHAFTNMSLGSLFSLGLEGIHSTFSGSYE